MSNKPIPNPNKGQHFLINKEIIQREVEIANISNKDRIIEIGAGIGNLTEEVSKKAGKVIAFEIDERYSEHLNLLKEKYPNLEIIYGNALEYSWKNYSKIVSNIPYFISEQVIQNAIKDKISELILIVGTKFSKKLKERKSKIGILANLFYDISFIDKINKENFSPIPRINSELIKLKKKDKFSIKESLLISILNKKGKIKNAIIYSLVEGGKTKREARKILKNMDISEFILEKPVDKITEKLLLRIENILNQLGEEGKLL